MLWKPEMKVSFSQSTVPDLCQILTQIGQNNHNHHNRHRADLAHKISGFEQVVYITQLARTPKIGLGNRCGRCAQPMAIGQSLFAPLPTSSVGLQVLPECWRINILCLSACPPCVWRKLQGQTLRVARGFWLMAIRPYHPCLQVLRTADSYWLMAYRPYPATAFRRFAWLIAIGLWPPPTLYVNILPAETAIVNDFLQPLPYSAGPTSGCISLRDLLTFTLPDLVTGAGYHLRGHWAGS